MKTYAGNPVELIKALDFAAGWHKFQRRKGYYRIPYINHPIRVVLILLQEGHVEQSEVLIAAALHDVIEDTECTPALIREEFGEKVLEVVLEVTDDMRLPSAERKRKQVEKAPMLSAEARLIKIADKMANMEDILRYPLDWSSGRKRTYFTWAREVASGCAGVNPALDLSFEKLFTRGMEQLG